MSGYEYEPIPLPVKRQMGLLMWELWKATILGNPEAPAAAMRRERMTNPQPGDIVVDITTLGRAVNHPDQDSEWCLDKWGGQFVRYLRTEVRGGTYEDGAPGSWSETVHVCQVPDGSTFTWSNCELVRAPVDGPLLDTADQPAVEHR